MQILKLKPMHHRNYEEQNQYRARLARALSIGRVVSKILEHNLMRSL